jgi:hypothetical protein
MVCVRAACLNQTIEGVFAFQRHLLASDSVDKLLSAPIHQLESGQNLGKLFLGLNECFLYLLKAFETKVGDIDGGRPLWALDRDGRDDTNGALATNEKLLQVVAGVVLAERAQVVYNCPIRKYSLNTQNVSVEATVSQKTKTACIGGDIATNLARSLRAQVEREDVILFSKESICRLKNYTGIGYKNSRNLIKRADLVHLLQIDDNLIENGDGATDETGVATLRNNGKHVVIAVLQDLAELFLVARLQYKLGVATKFTHPVTVEWLNIIRRIL